MTTLIKILIVLAVVFVCFTLYKIRKLENQVAELQYQSFIQQSEIYSLINEREKRRNPVKILTVSNTTLTGFGDTIDYVLNKQLK